jgi:hypothetical protein
MPIIRTCAWCKCALPAQPGDDRVTTDLHSDGICHACEEKHFPAPPVPAQCVRIRAEVVFDDIRAASRWCEHKRLEGWTCEPITCVGDGPWHCVASVSLEGLRGDVDPLAEWSGAAALPPYQGGEI